MLHDSAPRVGRLARRSFCRRRFAFPPRPRKPRSPGPLGEGVTLLPNGWRIAPAGRHLDVGDLPLAMALHPDGRHLVITNNGWSKPSLRVVDLKRREVIQKLPLDHAWLGLAWHPDGKRLYSSGAADNSIQRGRVEAATSWLLGRKLVVSPPQTTKDEMLLMNAGFMGGLAVSPDGRTLYAAQVYGKAVVSLDLADRPRASRAATSPPRPTPRRSRPTAARSTSRSGAAPRSPCSTRRRSRPSARSRSASTRTRCLFSKDGAPAVRRLRQHERGLGRRPDDARRSRSRSASRCRPTPRPARRPTRSRSRPTARRSSSRTPTTTRSRSWTSRAPGDSRFQGFIPTGWYPTGVAFDRGGENLLVLSGKGLTPVANPRGPQPVATREDSSYIAALLNGALSIVKRPDAAELAALSARVFALSAYNDGRREAPPGRPDGSPIPGRVGEPSPIKHVFYVIRENRTYDQVLGDLARGNGDPEPHALRRGRDAERARARARVRAVRQLLRGRRGELRRPRLLDGGLRHRRRREALADALRPARRALPERGRPRDPQPLRQPRGAGRRLPLGLREARRASRSAATASSPRGRRRAGRSRRRCRAWSARCTRAIRPTTCRSPTTSASTSGSRSSAASRRTAGCRGSTSSGSATTTPPAPRPAAPRRARWWPRTTSRSAGWSRRSRRAASGRSRRSSCSRTTPRTAPTTWTRTARCCSWRARGRSAAASTRRSTRPRACCARSSSCSACRR